MNLIIVESPTKSKTISKFLSGDFVVRSSYGHVRDLPKKELGVDIEHKFKPKYIIPTKAKKNVSELKKFAEKADTIILATDEDREGEAIAWHLIQALGLENPKSENLSRAFRGIRNSKQIRNSKTYPEKLKKQNIQRIVFHEITKKAIEDALRNPRAIDQNLVDAQQARRILDRLVGYKLSPFLWKKIRSGLSAGRVQSVAVRLVVEREREIQKFVPQEYWSVEANLSKQNEDRSFKARLVKVNGKTIDRLGVKNGMEAQKILDDLQGASYKVTDIVKKEVQRSPAPPFTTSTLQQEASKKFGFSAKQTMMIAQRLYETGLITYMRTDSLNIAQIAIAQAREVIKNHFGKEYALDQPRFYTNKSKGAQEAHEAIRPTDLSKIPENMKLDKDQWRLYDLIWKRTIACQMQNAVLNQTAVDIISISYELPAYRTGRQAASYLFRANGQVIKFDGFIKAYMETREDDEKDDEDYQEGQLPNLTPEEILILIDLIKDQHFTEPPPRYTDASLIKALEAHGVGRPSTYAPTLTTIQYRGYVEKDPPAGGKKYKPTEIGFSVNDMLVENFPEIIDINFTSHIEEELDDIAEGKIKWAPVIEEFYTPFKKNLDEKMGSVEKLTEISETSCPHCGKMMLVKFGRMGKFLACPEPGSKVTLPLPEEAAMIKTLEEKTKDESCPICGKSMLVKRGRFGYFLGCSDYPKCKGIAKIFNKTGFKCPNCRAQQTERDGERSRTTNSSPSTSSGRPDQNLVGELVEKKSRGRGKLFYACSRWPDCNFIMNKKPENQSELDAAYQHWQDNPPKPRKSKYYGKNSSTNT